jgi:hypothetical protein
MALRFKMSSYSYCTYEYVIAYFILFSRRVAFLRNIQFISIQFFIIYVPSQQLQGQLQTQHSVDTSIYIMDKHNIKSKDKLQASTEGKTH